MNASTTKTPDSERRQWSRFPLSGATDVTVHVGEQSYDATIVDLSVGGARLALDGTVEPAGKVAIDHESLGRLSGDCVWQSGSAFGLRFSDSDIARNAGVAHSCP